MPLRIKVPQSGKVDEGAAIGPREEEHPLEKERVKKSAHDEHA